MLSEPTQTSLDATVAEIDDELVALRRTIHRHPELAGGEHRTAALVADRLRRAGLNVTTGVGGCGVVAVLDGGLPGATVAYRADMDAVDADERAGGPFASEVPGAAHLCGHDVHASVGVGVALALARHRERVAGRVAFWFQPAEETLEGARAMIADGVLERAAPDEVYALHCGPLAVGTFAVMPGVGQPGLDRFRIVLTGPDAAAEGARLATFVEGLATVWFPRSPEEYERVSEDLLVPDGPLARFVLVGTAVRTAEGRTVVDAWLRAWPDSRYPELRRVVRDAASAVRTGTTAEVEYDGPPFPAMVCSRELSEDAATHLRAVFGADAVAVLQAAFPFNGEDFALFLHRVPGAMFYLGVANPAAGINGAPHSPDFAADERAIGVGVRAMAGLLVRRLGVLGT
jgi:metal-dependent amidase/aminoacylase/carboxypeptidase family protein